MEQFVDNHNIVIMNNGAPTRIVGNTETTTDLTICTAAIEACFHCTVSESPRDCGHCPIFITYEDERNSPAKDGSNNWRIKGALWEFYESSTAWVDIPRELDNCEELVADIYRKIEQASSEEIPRKEGRRFYPRPWWNNEVKESKMRRERLYQEYRRDKTKAKLIAWTFIKKSKKESWIVRAETDTWNASRSYL